MLMACAGAGQDAAAAGPVDLSLEVEQTLRLLTPSISKRVVVHTSLPKDLPAVLGNAAQIHQVVLNLILNASDAINGQAGSITVSTEKARFDSRFADNSFGPPDGEYVRLKVADTGCGMSPKTRARVFDPFFTTKPKGRGLGLAAVHGIVQSHGGAIQVESTPGAGTTFEVLFPCAGMVAAAQ